LIYRIEDQQEEEEEYERGMREGREMEEIGGIET